MLTGRANYERFLSVLRQEYNMYLLPDDVGRYPAAMLSAMWYWRDHRLNQLADMGAIDSVTLFITGSSADAEARKRRYLRILQILAAPSRG